MRNILVILITIFLYLGVSAQYSNSDWYFGVTNHLQFQGTQIKLNSDSISMGYVYNSFSISDTNHNLIITTNGCKVMNGSWEPIDGLTGIPCIPGWVGPPGINDSLTLGNRNENSALILPLPGSKSIYYVFCYKDTGSGPKQNQILFYNVVDMSLNNGKGEAIPPLNRMIYGYPFNDGITQMTAIKHANGRDWWLVAISVYFSSNGQVIKNNYIDKWLLTPAGLGNLNRQNIPLKTDGGKGQITVSNDGSQLVYGMNKYLYHASFDRCSGTSSNFTILDSIPDFNYDEGKTWYGASYSANDSIVYASTFVNLYQYILSPDGKPKKRTWLFNNPYWTNTMDSTAVNIGQLDLGTDSNVYVTYCYGYWWKMNKIYSHSLSTVYDAGLPYPQCTFKDHNIVTNFPSSETLPLNINWSLGALKGSGCDTLAIYDAAITPAKDKGFINIYPNPTDGYFIIETNYSAKQQLNVFNITGKLMLTQTLNGSKTTIDASNLPEGVYTVRLLGNNEVSNKNLVIVR